MTGPSGPTGTRRASTSKGRLRRQQLLQAAADLVAERGFHGVGIAEIGAGAGVTGAAIYRHFKDKTELLVALFDNVVDELLVRAGEVTATPGAPDAALDALVSHHVRFALRERALIAVYSQDAQNLPDEDRSRLRRNQRTYVLLWASELQRLRPELSPDDARTRVQATFGLLNSVANFPNRLSGEALGDLLHSMAWAALTS
ncbi:MAG: TetR/AcrR family transcriptional regulator [Acidimicrobiales bacterium]